MIVLALVFLAVAAASPIKEDPLALYRNYHENIGIPLATKIKAIEESQDFDGGAAPGRIWGGSLSPLTTNPHMGGVIMSLNNGGTSVCGSTLLNTRRVLTAAHCCSGVWSYEVVLGSSTLFFGGTRVRTSNAQIHENYNSWLITHDIAVLLFDAIIVLNPNIQPVALPIGVLQNNDFNGWWGTIAGFGEIDSSPINTNQMQYQADIQIVSNSVCTSVYGTSTINSDTMCCATTSGRSPCMGDSGGPLIVWSTNIRTLVGVYSFGHREGCHLGYPVGFTRVTSYLAWIQARL